MMNSAAQEAAVSWHETRAKPALNIIGPTSSGKTRLALLLCSRAKNPLVVSPLECEPADLARRIRGVHQSYTVRSVADFAGLSYGPRVDLLVVEDAEFLDAASARLLSELARQKLLPIVCVSPEPLQRPPPQLFKQVRLFKPTVRQAAAEIARSRGVDESVALAVCARFGGDMRQAKIELGLLCGRSGSTAVRAQVTNSDPLQRTPVEAARALFSAAAAGRDAFATEALRCSERDDASLVRSLVAEHYVKSTAADPASLAEAAEAASLADSLPRASRHVADVVGVSAAEFAPGAKIPFSAGVAAAPRCCKCTADWTLVDAVERRIVRTLAARGASAARAVALEMSSLGLEPRIAEWDGVRAAAAVGRQPTPVPAEARAALAFELGKLAAASQQ